MSTGEFAPTHVAPAEGMQVWDAPDPSRPVIANLQPGVQLQLLERRGAWARVAFSNGWAGWVDGRRIVETAPPPPRLQAPQQTPPAASQTPPAARPQQTAQAPQQAARPEPSRSEVGRTEGSAWFGPEARPGADPLEGDPFAEAARAKGPAGPAASKPAAPVNDWEREPIENWPAAPESKPKVTSPAPPSGKAKPGGNGGRSGGPGGGQGGGGGGGRGGNAGGRPAGGGGSSGGGGRPSGGGAGGGGSGSAGRPASSGGASGSGGQGGSRSGGGSGSGSGKGTGSTGSTGSGGGSGSGGVSRTSTPVPPPPSSSSHDDDRRFPIDFRSLRITPAIVGAGGIILGSLFSWARISGATGNAFDVPLKFLWDYKAGGGGLKIGLLLLVLALGVAALCLLPGRVVIRRALGGAVVAVTLIYIVELARVLHAIRDAAKALPTGVRPHVPGLLSAIGFGVFITIAAAIAVIVDRTDPAD